MRTLLEYYVCYKFMRGHCQDQSLKQVAGHDSFVGDVQFAKLYALKSQLPPCSGERTIACHQRTLGATYVAMPHDNYHSQGNQVA